MRYLLPLTAVSLFSITLHAEVFDLGDLKQYEPTIDKVPDGLDPGSIHILEADEESFSILLGQDVKAKVDGAVQSCKEMDDQCFKTINNILRDAHVQMNQDLEPRWLLVAATAVGNALRGVKTLAQVLGILALALFANGGKQIYNEEGSNLPALVASNAAKLPEGVPITISAAGSAIATVTQEVEETTLEGSITPVVTVVQSASDGFEKGDLAGVLDADLANRLDEFMHISKNCQAGWEFDKEHPSNRRASGTYGQALCAAQGVIQNANGPFNDLVLLDPAGAHFEFTKAAGAARDAANVLAEFVAAYRGLITLPEDLIDDIPTYVLALAIDTIVENIPLGERNRIKATMVTTTDSPSSTSTGCPKPESLICGIGEKEDCSPKFVGDEDNKKAVCKEGKQKECECSLPGQAFVNYADENRQKLIKKLKDLFDSDDDDEGEPEGKAECSKDKKTSIPASIFSSKSNKVYGHFCDGWPQGNDMWMMVDSKGKDIDPDWELRERAVVNADTYKGSAFELTFKKGEGSGKCTRDCNSAFDQLSKACATSSPEMMYEEGSLDVGCGIFGYKVTKHEEITELKEFKQFCYKKDDFEPLAKAGVNKDAIREYTGIPCTGVARPQQVIKKDDKSTFIHWRTSENKVPYQYSIWWKDGCVLADDGPTAAYASNPLMLEKPGHTLCFDNLYRNWKDCNNGGVGGNIQIGCLVYEFKADKNERTW